jgi:hypothetical protein
MPTGMEIIKVIAHNKLKYFVRIALQQENIQIKDS